MYLFLRPDVEGFITSEEESVSELLNNLRREPQTLKPNIKNYSERLEKNLSY